MEQLHEDKLAQTRLSEPQSLRSFSDPSQSPPGPRFSQGHGPQQLVGNGRIETRPGECVSTLCDMLDGFAG